MQTTCLQRYLRGMYYTNSVSGKNINTSCGVHAQQRQQYNKDVVKGIPSSLSWDTQQSNLPHGEWCGRYHHLCNCEGFQWYIYYTQIEEMILYNNQSILLLKKGHTIIFVEEYTPIKLYHKGGDDGEWNTIIIVLAGSIKELHNILGQEEIQQSNYKCDCYWGHDFGREVSLKIGGSCRSFYSGGEWCHPTKIRYNGRWLSD